MKLEYDVDYTNTFHSPGIEPWITGFLKGKQFANALDIGCGLGFAALLLKLYLNNVGYLIGLDVSHNKVVKARKLNLYDDLIVGDARFPPFKCGSIEMIISTEVIHGFSANILGIIEKPLKEKGYVVLSLPSLPKELRVKNLIEKGYHAYRYLLRGFILIDLNNYEILLASNSKLFRIVRIILKVLRPMLKAMKAVEKGYILAFKCTS